MTFHLGLFPIGWIGVPLFFVLSGYLITSILIDARRGALKEYLVGFYWRRTLRIFPLYYAYLLVNALLTLKAGLSVSGYGWFVAYLGNYQIAALAPTVPGGIIGHLWSLAVEEQFYLLWPLAVFFIRRMWIVAAVAIILAPVVREILLFSTGNSYLAILTLPSCIDMLAAGALVALVENRHLLTMMGSSGFAICVWCLWKVPIADFSSVPLWVPQAHIMYTGLALLFAPLVKCAAHIKFLDNPQLVWVGKISYGLYMWHMLAFAAVNKMHLPYGGREAVGLMLAFGSATLSWYLFEKPILKMKALVPSNPAHGAANE